MTCARLSRNGRRIELPGPECNATIQRRSDMQQTERHLQERNVLFTEKPRYRGSERSQRDTVSIALWRRHVRFRSKVEGDGAMESSEGPR